MTGVMLGVELMRYFCWFFAAIYVRRPEMSLTI